MFSGKPGRMDGSSAGSSVCLRVTTAGCTVATASADRTEGLPQEFARLLAITEYPPCWSSTLEGEFALAVYHRHRQEGLRTLAYLAKHKTPDLAVRSALAALARDPPVIAQEMG